eukprot:CAMPEP_0115352906 /NCGR_PEP_ID=MMETSP0270-20121206/97754_1 /TAXON_ID=71861 /ORGANISM="Scrippsiella trochoidea, Strain CCMP3099" /LENGTH=102 /DNA_ID=CAMNT_0002775107 /DNA_START=118 /DNA_END=426 /DNA_ORIENTATION=-
MSLKPDELRTELFQLLHACTRATLQLTAPSAEGTCSLPHVCLQALVDLAARQVHSEVLSRGPLAASWPDVSLHGQLRQKIACQARPPQLRTPQWSRGKTTND